MLTDPDKKRKGLTDIACQKAKCPPDKKRKRFTDARGLYLEVSPAGKKRWFAKLYINGKESRIALGSYPEVSLAQARIARDGVRKERAEGLDPRLERKRAKLAASVAPAQTFQAFADAWLEAKAPGWAPSTLERETRNVEKDLVPYLGPLAVASLTPPELLAVVRKVEDRGASSTADKVLITMTGILSHAVAAGAVQTNAAIGLGRLRKKRVERHYAAIVDPEGLQELLRAMRAYAGSRSVRAALWLSAMLFQRPGNMREMSWEHIDLGAARWTIPSAEMKRTVEQKLHGAPHVVPLPTQAIEILNDRKRHTKSHAYVFPGRNAASALSQASVTSALKSMGYHEEQSWHGFRATARTLIRQELRFPSDVIEAQLAHVGQVSLRGAYDRAQYVEERAEMLQAWADYLDALAAGVDPAEAATQARASHRPSP